MASGVVKRVRSKGRRRNLPMSEINVTPFVDVMLVLLIIFMVAAPLMTAGVPLNLPETAANAVPNEDEEPLMVSIPVEGSLTIMDQPVADEQVVTTLRTILAERQSGRVFLRADGTIPYARVVQIMGALNAAGITDIVLVTETGGPRMDG
ncbi:MULTISPECIES: ExbD/TolR family protein [Paracoccus]|mgnify:CR=1 FL=1|jgi:biopolymer transport protein TolR|uniref:ExbD/TolR family protein n=3 Tax=Paracoccus TaxID=265 RepID=A0A5C4R619_9RHOB|nr:MULTISPECIES: ExbD/TolR family protein [Paracoccus]TYP67078.1 cell division and transport-associated protein TolR [Stutzerimonas stutzeri]AZY94869.1 ExbD/TolR family protein [Paracoccus sp. Arc7-R13]KIX16859.1 biopolymer transporter ExbD [Paracoccus sp. 228]MBF5079568.1 ExbD/TolR family protein [Paracoccus sp. NBH48]MCO6361176.1 protein TolR [Paracoccus sp. 08]|tara:strand:+ start:2499 stop:2948 length:450 start_codon:yes stop_codon:yes gene_type:complete